MADQVDTFEEEPVREMYDLVLDLDGFEGPIDLLLTLARQQKVDLAKMSILKLAEQYLAFITAAKQLRLEVAADYLVMAAWLAYLKSRLLLPATEEDEEASGPELAEALTFQLRRLDSMRDAGEKLLVMPRLGRDVFRRGAPEGMEVIRTAVYEVSLYDLLKAYGDNRRRATGSHLTIEASQLFSLSDAIERLRGVIGEVRDWTSLSAFLPEDLMDGLFMRSAVASTFAASLEMVKEGKADIRQSSAFGPIFIKGKEAAANG
ncbi:MAG: segregation and condensation protein A [Paracoccaceae bacterium]|jgi:segregation and condensation protein A